MDRIDKLILKARAAMSGGLELGVAMVEREGDFWAAVVHIHDGVTGHSPTIKRATFATLDKAIEYIQAVAVEYPNSRDVPILVDDLR